MKILSAFYDKYFGKKKEICYDQSKVKSQEDYIMEELKNNSVVEEDTEGTVVVITDEEGN